MTVPEHKKRLSVLGTRAVGKSIFLTSWYYMTKRQQKPHPFRLEAADQTTLNILDDYLTQLTIRRQLLPPTISEENMLIDLVIDYDVVNTFRMHVMDYAGEIVDKTRPYDNPVVQEILSCDVLMPLLRPEMLQDEEVFRHQMGTFYLSVKAVFDRHPEFDVPIAITVLQCDKIPQFGPDKVRLIAPGEDWVKTRIRCQDYNAFSRYFIAKYQDAPQWSAFVSLTLERLRELLLLIALRTYSFQIFFVSALGQACVQEDQALRPPSPIEPVGIFEPPTWAMREFRDRQKIKRTKKRSKRLLVVCTVFWTLLNLIFLWHLLMFKAAFDYEAQHPQRLAAIQQHWEHYRDHWTSRLFFIGAPATRALVTEKIDALRFARLQTAEVADEELSQICTRFKQVQAQMECGRYQDLTARLQKQYLARFVNNLFQKIQRPVSSEARFLQMRSQLLPLLEDRSLPATVRQEIAAFSRSCQKEFAQALYLQFETLVRKLTLGNLKTQYAQAQQLIQTYRKYFQPAQYPSYGPAMAAVGRVLPQIMQAQAAWLKEQAFEKNTALQHLLAKIAAQGLGVYLFDLNSPLPTHAAQPHLSPAVSELFARHGQALTTSARVAARGQHSMYVVDQAQGRQYYLKQIAKTWKVYDCTLAKPLQGLVQDLVKHYYQQTFSKLRRYIILWQNDPEKPLGDLLSAWREARKFYQRFQPYLATDYRRQLQHFLQACERLQGRRTYVYRYQLHSKDPATYQDIRLTFVIGDQTITPQPLSSGQNEYQLRFQWCLQDSFIIRYHYNELGSDILEPDKKVAQQGQYVFPVQQRLLFSLQQTPLSTRVFTIEGCFEHYANILPCLALTQHKKE